MKINISLLALTVAFVSAIQPFASQAQQVKSVSKPKLSAVVAQKAEFRLPLPPKDWTILGFLNGKSHTSGATNANFNSLGEVASTPHINVVAEVGLITWSWDREGFGPTGAHWGGVRRYYIAKDATQADEDATAIVRLPNPPDKNMGSGQHLEDFIRWGKANFPAKKYLLIVDGHGSGVCGLSFDDRSKDYIEVVELAKAIENIGGIDLLYLHSCLMQNVETLYQLRNSVKHVIAAEGGIPCIDDYVIPSEIQSNPDASPAKVAQCSTSGLMSALELSNVKLSAMGGFVSRFNAWLDVVMKSGETSAITQSMERTLTFMNDMRDLGSFVRNVTRSTNNPEIKKAGEELTSYISNKLLAGFAPNDSRGATGISIYFPNNAIHEKTYQNLAFGYDTKWLDFLAWMGEHKLFPEKNPPGLE